MTQEGTSWPPQNRRGWHFANGDTVFQQGTTPLLLSSFNVEHVVPSCNPRIHHFLQNTPTELAATRAADGDGEFS